MPEPGLAKHRGAAENLCVVSRDYAIQSPVLRAILGIGIGVIILASAVGGLLLLVFRTDTTYAPGYSEREFFRLEIGTPRSEVLKKLGEPLWSEPLPALALPPGQKIVGDDEVLDREDRGGILYVHGNRLRDPAAGEELIWRWDGYSKQGPENTHYLMRHVIYDERDRVIALYKEFYFD